VKDVTRRDVKRLLAGITAPVEANRVQALISKLFSYALDEEIITTHPCIRLRKHKEQSRSRVLSHEEIRTFWQACEDMPSTMSAAFRLRLVTAQRGKEVVMMRWSDVDLTTGWWTIPSEYSKNRLPHRVALSSLALDIIKALRQEADAYAQAHPQAKPAVFILRGSRGKRQRRSASKVFTIVDFVLHDLRRSAATYMTSSGTPRLVVQKVLNHSEKGVTSVYDRASYDLEKRQALDRWAVVLAAIIEKKDNVLPFVASA
jgi:integrase